MLSRQFEVPTKDAFENLHHDKINEDKERAQPRCSYTRVTATTPKAATPSSPHCHPPPMDQQARPPIGLSQRSSAA